jgi:hypothetical protein
MGAGIVVAPGRNADLLDALVRRFGTRVRPVRLTGDEGADRAAMLAAAGPVDLVLDLSLFDVTTFSLDETEKAVADAAAHARNFHLTTICPR